MAELVIYQTAYLCMKFQDIFHMAPAPRIDILTVVADDNEMRSRM